MQWSDGVAPELALDQLLTLLVERAHEVTSRQKWFEATAAITRYLLFPQATEPLAFIADQAREVFAADVATVVLPTAVPGRLRVEYAGGAGADTLLGYVFGAEHSMAAEAFAGRVPVVTADAKADERFDVHLGHAVDVAAVLVVPLIGTECIRGVLALGRLRGAALFVESELQMATAFANHAALALELADARADQMRIELLEDRDRIARELHDQVIQRLFAAGMTLQGVAAGLEPGECADRIEGVLGDLDDTIAAIRTSIFGLRGSFGPDADTARARLIAVVAEAASSLGTLPQVLFAGPIDDVVDAELSAELVAVLREALLNVAQHADADRVEVRLRARLPDLVLEIVDNGVGVRGNSDGPSLAELRRRAHLRGGACTITDAPVGHAGPKRKGTQLTWTIPLR